jgi:hypothetical protein
MARGPRRIASPAVPAAGGTAGDVNPADGSGRAERPIAPRFRGTVSGMPLTRGAELHLPEPPGRNRRRPRSGARRRRPLTASARLVVDPSRLAGMAVDEVEGPGAAPSGIRNPAKAQDLTPAAPLTDDTRLLAGILQRPGRCGSRPVRVHGLGGGTVLPFLPLAAATRITSRCAAMTGSRSSATSRTTSGSAPQLATALALTAAPASSAVRRPWTRAPSNVTVRRRAATTRRRPVAANGRNGNTEWQHRYRQPCAPSNVTARPRATTTRRRESQHWQQRHPPCKLPSQSSPLVFL